jgi:copper transport protein
MRSRTFAVALVFCGLGVLCAPRPADAHAVLRSSVPANGENRATAPRSVTLNFSESPDLRASDVKVLDTQGRNYAEMPQRVPGDPLSLRVPLDPPTRGVYTVSWRVLSTADGHVTAGAFAFGVAVSPNDIKPSGTAVVELPPISPVETAGRFALYAGLSLLVGAALMSVLATDVRGGGLVRLGIAAWLLAAAGVVVLGAAQLDAAGGLGPLMRTRIGHALVARAAFLLIAVLALPRTPRAQGSRVRAAAVLASLAGLMLVHVWAGHAAADGIVWLKVATQWAHFAAATMWMGGLAGLLVTIVGGETADKARAVRWFSTMAGVSIAVVAGTGTARAVNEVGSWSALLDTGYGRLVIAKTVLFGVLVVLGAWNRYSSVPRADTDLRPLRLISRSELAIGAVVLALTGLLASLGPPDQTVRAEQAERTVVSASDFARTVRVRLEVRPGYPGVNAFVVSLSDPSTGDGVRANGVTLRFTPLRNDVSESVLRLRGSGSVWRGSGANLAVGGAWRVSALVERGAASVEVPLVLHTRCRVTALGGEPPLYSIPLGEGREVQSYVDPGRAGTNEVHFTFFTAEGDELPIRTDAAMTTTRAGSEPETLPVRRFGPGHFIGDAELTAARWTFDLTVELDDGETVQACFEERIEP